MRRARVKMDGRLWLELGDSFGVATMSPGPARMGGTDGVRCVQLFNCFCVSLAPKSSLLKLSRTTAAVAAIII